MNDQTDQQLLHDYAERQSEAAFAAIVHRYVDLVYSAAFRMVCDDHAAKDVTQAVFVVLAQNARQLTDRPALAGWLHGAARNLAVKAVRSDVRRRAREQEAVVMNELLSGSSDANWEHIAPHLDAALGELSEPDRDAVLLRYFKNHDLRTVGATLGISDDAAQKRVSRAVERLREFFAKRGVTVGASGLAVVISANAVQAAPAGLALTISTAAALTGTALATTATVTATKAIAMPAIQKTIVTATIAVLAGVGIYEARQASQLSDQVQMLQQQQASMGEQIQQLERERDAATNQLASLQDDNERLNRNTGELLRLRGEVTRLRNATDSPAAKLVSELMDTSNPLWKPNWIVLRPFDLGQFSDSATKIASQTAKDVGTATPAALLQTWIWAQRISDAAGILKTWNFPEGTTEEQKDERVAEAQRDQEYARKNPDRIGHAEVSRLRDLFELGDGYYLAFIEEKGLTTGPWVSYQIFRQVGAEWKVSFGREVK